MAIADRREFIVANTRVLPVPHAPEIKLHLADEATALWRKTEEELGQIGLPPPFWAFAWAGGQALARYLLDHRESVADRRVLDFAAGSGLVDCGYEIGREKSRSLRDRRIRRRGDRAQRGC